MIEPAIERRILEVVDQQKESIIDLVRKLVRIPSVCGNEEECAMFCASKLKNMGLELDVWEPDLEELEEHKGYSPVERGYKGRPNVVGVLKGTGGGRSLLFNGHMDVVPFDVDLWKHDPVGGEIDDGKIYGRGSLDMKAGLAIVFKAIESVQEAGIGLNGDIIVECVVDEERSGNGTLASVLRGYKADAGIIPEPWGIENIVFGHRGSIGFKITTGGRFAPLQDRVHGVSAIENMMKIVGSLKDLGTARAVSVKHPWYQEYMLPLLVNKIQGGNWFASVPLRCECEGFLGWVQGENPENLKQMLRTYVETVSGVDPWLRENPPCIDFNMFLEPCAVPIDHPILETVQAQVKKVVGQEALRMVANAGSDQNKLVLYGDTPTIQFGPGGGQSHGPDEFVLIDEILDCTKILALTIPNWCGYEAS